MDTVTLGSKYRDTATGFVGTATAEIRYLGGDHQVLLEVAKADLSTGVSSEWFRIGRLTTA